MTSASAPISKQTKNGSDPASPLPKAAWWHRKLEPEERQRVMKDLAIRKIEHWIFRFGVMITLSVIVAVMGLLLNSAAVVIGAMLLAPLMQPVLATAACVSMALFKKSLGALTKVVVATAWCIGLAYLLSKLLPDQVLTSEVLSRTRPDGKDLIVALAAGAAGAYATVREDASASLPGVAVAVALVPPLGAVGITLEAGELEKAWGAMLLYTTNLAAIILAGVFVFVLTGFVPPRRLATNSTRLALATLSIIILVGLIGWPLVQASKASAQDSRNDASALDIVNRWISDTDVVDEVDVESDHIKVSLRGSGQPPDDVDLKEQLRSVFSDREVRVEWLRVGVPTTSTTAPPADAQLVADVEEVVEEWLSGSDDAEVDNIILNGSELRVDASGVGEPPSVDDLSRLLDGQFEQTFALRLNWSQRQSIKASNGDSNPLEEAEQAMTVAIDMWATQNNLVVDSFTFDGRKVEIDLSGGSEPDVGKLVEQLAEIAGEPIEVSAFFTERKELDTTTTTRQANSTTTATIAE